MVRSHGFKGMTLAVLLGSLGPGLAVAADNDPLVQMIKFLWRPFAEQNARSARADQFREKTKYCVVITNESRQDWKFGCDGKASAAMKDKPSGTLQVAGVRANGTDFFPPDAVDDTTPPVVIGRNYGTVVVTPVNKRGMVYGSEKFARLCYLEDAKGKRIYLTLTKDTSSTAVPVIGIADGASNKVVMEQKAIHFSDKQLKNLNMIGISIDGIQ
jgi:hypothetical protein